MGVVLHTTSQQLVVYARHTLLHNLSTTAYRFTMKVLYLPEMQLFALVVATQRTTAVMFYNYNYNPKELSMIN